ncbi:hypothetical protein B0H19DRAFT_964893, partial [Mycena capillaripes]
PLFRGWAGSLNDHFYTTAPNEVLTAGGQGGVGYMPDGVAAGIFPTQIASSTPLFRLWKNSVKDHAYTASAIEVDALQAAGYVLETTPGFVYTTQLGNSVPLYGLFSPSLNDHFMTTSASERDNVINGGYTYQGIVAYVPVPGVIVGDTPSSC